MPISALPHSARTRSAVLAFVTATWFALAAPIAHADRTAGQHVDDSNLATSTKAALVEADLASASAINVEVYKGVVQLAGFVRSAEDRATAVEVARKIHGARQVLDAMVVMAGRRSAGQTLDDTTIQTKLKAELTDRLGVDLAVTINTEVRKGQVILSGFVADAGARTQAGEIARGIAGVVAVHNELAAAD